MPNIARLVELTRFDFVHSLISLKGLVFIIPYFFFWYLIFSNVSHQAVEWLESPQGLMFASWLLDDQDLVMMLFVDRPANLSIYLLISITVMPLFMMLAANNQYSSDASRGAFRFILTRVTRAEVFIARFISVLILTSICLFITLSWATFQSWSNNEDTLTAIILFSFETYIIILFYSLPFIAFMSMISAFARSGFSALFLGMMLYVILIALSFWLTADIEYARYLTPASIKPYIFNINLQNSLISLVALSVYTMIYLVCGWQLFKRRDM